LSIGKGIFEMNNFKQKYFNKTAAEQLWAAITAMFSRAYYSNIFNKIFSGRNQQKLNLSNSQKTFLHLVISMIREATGTRGNRRMNVIGGPKS
jgi:tRNA(Glu) U13 pseudouridine synthase TruD